MTDTSVRPRAGVQAVERAFDVLEVLAASREPIGISTVAKHTGLPEPTVHRLLRTLAAKGYVRQSPDRHKYFLGWRLASLGEAATTSFHKWAQSYLTELADVSSESATLAILEGSQILYVAQVPSRHRVRMFTEVGNRADPHARASGKVLLAFRPRDVVVRLVERNGLRAHTPNTITNATRLYAELDLVAQQGFAVDDEESELGVRGLAVPVFVGASSPVSAMSVSGPAGRLDRAAREQLVPEMRRIAAELSASWVRRQEGH